MSTLNYRDNQLFLEACSLQEIAEKFGTPCYVYSKTAIEKNWQSLTQAFKNFPHFICYAVKANNNLAILNLFAEWHAGFDIVSLGELKKVLAASGKASRVIFSGVGKSVYEIEQAIDANIYCFDVESADELERINFIAHKKNKIVNIGLRINPQIKVPTHEYIATGSKENKFGIDAAEVNSIIQQLKKMDNLNLIGIACHIGSQITEIAPFLEALDKLIEIYHALHAKNFSIRHINMGGGLGIAYHAEAPPSIQDYAQSLINKLDQLPVELIIEPGRYLVGNAGLLLTRVEYLKHNQNKNFAIVDAGMNDLLRPALYNAWQPILPVKKRDGAERLYDIAGPVCESADFLGKERKLSLISGDLLAIDLVGAYGFSMSSNYNSRLKPAEIMVADHTMQLIRKRETYAELMSEEFLLTSKESTLR